MSREIEITCQDGVILSGEYFESDTQPGGVIVVSGALGVRRGFYKNFAKLAASEGYDVLIYSYRGVEPAYPTSKTYKLSDWGVKDIGSAIQFCREGQLLLPVYYVGHSIGAQLLGLSSDAGSLKAAAFVCGSFPYWKRWVGKNKIKMFFLFNVLIPFFSKFTRTFPARAFGLGSIDIPSSIMLEWSRWVRDKDYVLSEKFFLPRATLYRLLEIPIVSFIFDDDAYVPWSAAQKMHEAYSAANIEVRYKSALAAEVGHFGFFRNETLQRELIDYFKSTVAAPGY
jgi:predicted alpha/beta hydrolase